MTVLSRKCRPAAGLRFVSGVSGVCPLPAVRRRRGGSEISSDPPRAAFSGGYVYRVAGS